jgi:16S rRNA (cytosine967-C5)-methyltransferase
MTQNPRQLSLIALREVHLGAYADVALERVLSKASINALDRRLVTDLVYGSVRRQRTLDALVEQFAKKKSQPPELVAILHLGLYQLRYLERIPESAAVNTTVQLAKENGFAGLTGFVNGLLRAYVRSAAESDPLKLPENQIQRLGILYSFPDWIVELWLEQLGVAETEQLCEWMNQSPAIDLRVNVLRSNRDEVEAAMLTHEVLVSRPPLPQALRLISSTGAIPNLPGFHEGWWTVQDSSAQLVSYLLAPQPGEVIIDACAAPGGKTTHIAELMGDEGVVWAGDRTASRLRKLQENAQRLQLNSIQICLGDSRNFPQFRNSADRVLLDVPCSGLGTLHRHADARWRQSPESIQQLAILQSELLAHASTFVKSGGVLVYATCTLHKHENEDVISAFLAVNLNWQIDIPQPEEIAAKFVTPEGWLKLWPHRQHMDGFFMVRLKKA